jgi:hypothetical protein
MTGQEGLCHAPLHGHWPTAFFTKPFNDKKISQLSGLRRICINPLKKNDPVSEILDTKEMTNSICYPKIT